MVDNNNILKFPYSNTPFWEYLDLYYINCKKSGVMGDVYLRNKVPEQLRKQVKETLECLMNEQN